MKSKEYCFIISGMRSGSTLLKALIATRPDCSHLPETKFNEYKTVKSDKRIIVIKKPAGHRDFEYPILEDINCKKIILIRNPYDTICSLQRMFISRNETNSKCNTIEYLISYWYIIYNNIIERKLLQSDNTLLVRYEDLIDRPIEETSKIFNFIGTDYPDGTDTYSSPENYNWGWGNDDGGEIIKSLKVQKSIYKRDNKILLDFVNTNFEIQNTLTAFGYINTRFN